MKAPAIKVKKKKLFSTAEVPKAIKLEEGGGVKAFNDFPNHAPSANLTFVN